MDYSKQSSATSNHSNDNFVYTDTIGVSFVVHNSDVLFPTNSTNQTLGSDVISAIVPGVANVRDLSEPVVLEFTVSALRFISKIILYKL